MMMQSIETVGLLAGHGWRGASGGMSEHDVESFLFCK